MSLRVLWTHLYPSFRVTLFSTPISCGLGQSTCKQEGRMLVTLMPLYGHILIFSQWRWLNIDIWSYKVTDATNILPLSFYVQQGGGWSNPQLIWVQKARLGSLNRDKFSGHPSSSLLMDAFIYCQTFYLRPYGTVWMAWQIHFVKSAGWVFFLSKSP